MKVPNKYQFHIEQHIQQRKSNLHFFTDKKNHKPGNNGSLLPEPLENY